MYAIDFSGCQQHHNPIIETKHNTNNDCFYDWGNSIDASHQNKRTKKQKAFREKAAEHKNKKENPIERVLKSTQISFYE